MLTGTALATLLEAEPGPWRRADLDRLTGALGLRVDPERSDDWWVRLVSDGPLYGTVTLRQSWHEPKWFGECVRFEVGWQAPDDELFQRYRELIVSSVAVLGPPPLIGGDGAFVLWRRPTTLVTLDQSTRFEKSRITVTLEPREATEGQAWFEGKWQEDWEPEYRWRMQPAVHGPAAASLSGMTSFGQRWARDWESLADNMRRLFGSMAHDIPVLDPYSTRVRWRICAAVDGDDHWVRGYFDAEQAHLETCGIPDWLAPVDNDWRPVVSLPAGDAATGVRVAELALTEIRTWGVSDPTGLRYQAWCDGEDARLYDFCLGLADLSDRTTDFE